LKLVQIHKVSIDKTVKDAMFKILYSSQLQNLYIDKPIIIKPNILSEQAPPKTTDVLVVHALVQFLKLHFSNCPIIIAEGCCTTEYTTTQLFDIHGYTKLAEIEDVLLVDLNIAPTSIKYNEDALSLNKFFVSNIFDDAFVISVPALKGHGLVGFTGCLKNMFGIAPAYIYKVLGRANKFALHKRLHDSIVDINRYVKIDFCIMDASIGLKDHHRYGIPCNPPINELYCGYDPVAMDIYCCPKVCSKTKWEHIPYLVWAEGTLGSSKFEVIEC